MSQLWHLGRIIYSISYFFLIRKSTTKLNNVDRSSTRLPNVDTSKLDPEIISNGITSNGTISNGETAETTAKYNHDKTPLQTDTNEEIEYTLTIYNEGETDGYAGEIKDYLPAGIEYVGLVNEEDSSKYEVKAQKDNVTGKTVLTITNKEKKILKAYNKETGKLDSVEFKIKCKVTAERTEEEQVLTNIAEITDYRDSQGNDMKDKDRDSTPSNFPEDKKNNEYNGNGKDGNYVPGQEDDDDFEKVIIPKKEKEKTFDLSLRKFIVAVSKDDTLDEKDYIKNVDGSYKRAPIVDTSKLNTTDENGKLITTAEYKHTKEPILVAPNNIVVYMLRVYNEGDIDGYASEIKDHLPESLEYVDGEFNQKYGWNISEDGRTVTTTYLKGNARKRNKSEGGNVFNIQTGVAIMFLIKKGVSEKQNKINPLNQKKANIKYYNIGDFLSGDKKLMSLQQDISFFDFEDIIPDNKGQWLNQTNNDFYEHTALIDKNVKNQKVGKAIEQKYFLRAPF